MNVLVLARMHRLETKLMCWRSWNAIYRGVNRERPAAAAAEAAAEEGDKT